MASHTEETSDGDVVEVKIGSLGGELKTVALEAGATVADALAAAGLPSDAEVRCNGETYSASDTVDDGDSMIVLGGQKVKGGKVK